MKHVAKNVAVLSFAIAGVLGAGPARAATFADDTSTVLAFMAPSTGPASAPAAPAEIAPGIAAAGAATHPAATAPIAAGVVSLKVTVAAVTGNVQVRSDESQPWQTATVGMVIGEGAEFRTGPRSSVRCTIPPDQSFTVDRMSTVKVLQAIKNGSKLRTDMLMKYGRTKYSVEAAGLEHEGTIASPSGTLAVRGTVVSLYDQPPFVPQAVSYTGRAMFRDIHRETAFGGKNAGKQTVDGNKDSAAETALYNSVVDPKFAAARTRTDKEVIAQETSRGAFTSFDPLANITVVRGGFPISNDIAFAAQLPGRLDFTVRWFGPADVNIEVFAMFGEPLTLLSSPTGFQPTEFLYPGYGLNNSKSGGHIPFDHRGGPNGGTEIAYWPTVPHGVYGVVAQHISGAPVEVKINAFVDGQKQFLFFGDNGDTTVDATLGGTDFATGLVFIPGLAFSQPAAPTGRHTRTGPTVAAGHGPAQSGNQGPNVVKSAPTSVKAGAAYGHTR